MSTAARLHGCHAVHHLTEAGGAPTSKHSGNAHAQHLNGIHISITLTYSLYLKRRTSICSIRDFKKAPAVWSHNRAENIKAAKIAQFVSKHIGPDLAGDALASPIGQISTSAWRSYFKRKRRQQVPPPTHTPSTHTYRHPPAPNGHSTACWPACPVNACPVLFVSECRCCAELLRENKRMLDKAIRDLDRERAGLQSQEKKLIVEIKKMAKQNQMVCTPRSRAYYPKPYDPKPPRGAWSPRHEAVHMTQNPHAEHGSRATKLCLG